MMCRVQEWQLLLSYFLSYFPLVVSDAISCLLRNLKTFLVFYYDTSELCRIRLVDVSGTRMTTLTFILSELFPLDVSDAISCPLHNLNTLWYIIMILYSYVEQIMMTCLVKE